MISDIIRRKHKALLKSKSNIEITYLHFRDEPFPVIDGIEYIKNGKRYFQPLIGNTYGTPVLIQ